MRGLRTRVLVVAAATSLGLVVAPTAASASADARASCVGIIVSTLGSAGQLDVDDFKAIAEAEGARNFGQFVSFGARLHEGSLEACLPQ